MKNDWYSTKMIWTTYPNCPKPSGPIEGQGNRQQIKLSLTNWQYPLINYLAMEATGQRKVGITELLPIGVSHVPQEGQIVMLQVNRGLKLDLGKVIHPKYYLQRISCSAVKSLTSEAKPSNGQQSFGQTKNWLVFGRLACTIKKTLKS